MITPPSSHSTLTFCITELDVGGAEKALVRIATGLQQRGWNVRVISLRDKGPLAKQLEAVDIPVTGLNCGGFLDVRTFWRLRTALRQDPTDILFCFLHQANIYGRIAAKSAGVSTVLSGIRVADRRLSVVIPERITRCCVDHYVAVSQQVANTHARLCKIPSSQITAIPNGVDLPADPAVQHASEDKFRILFVGRLTEQKDPLTLLDAFQQLPQDIRDKTSLTLVGEGPLRRAVEQQIEHHQLQQKVTLPGQRDDIQQLMQQATILVLPSRWEGMPNVVLEAMANGLPVVATSVDGTRELITDGQTGWLVPPQEPQILSEAITDAFRHPEKRRQFSNNGLILVEESHNWAAVIDCYDSLLRSLSS